MMIQSFRNKGPQAFFESATLVGITTTHSKRLEKLLNALHQSHAVKDMNRPGFKLHALRGKPQRWAVWVNSNWRLTFEFVDGEAREVDYEDYH